MSNLPLSEGFGQLRSLVTLDLGGCLKLLALPEGIPPRILPSLYCPGHFGASERGRGISSSVVLNRSLSEGFGEQLVNLTDFNLNGCVKLQELPESICNMRSLTKLDLRGGPDWECGPMSLRALPKRFGQLESLVQLNLSYCRSLKELPAGAPAHILPPVPPESCLN